MCAESDCACAALAETPEGRSPAGLGDGLRRLARLRARTDARYAAWIAEAERTHAAETQGFGSTCEWLASLSGEPVPVARRQVAVAEALEQMPETKKAFCTGEVSESKVRLLAQAQALAPEQFHKDEASLVAAVGAASPQQAPQVVASWKREADPQAAEVQAERLYQRRRLHLSKDWSDLVHLSGDLHPAGGVIVMEALDSLSDPAHLDPADTRTPAQARADALVEICRRYLDGHNGSRRPPRVLVTIPWNSLQGGRGIVDTQAGPIGAATARLLTCDATVSRVLLDPDGIPVETGRATRVIPPALRRALELRDQHCTHPGCQMPARWCDAHHIQHWAEGGKTDLSNVRLLCRAHHGHAHQGEWRPKRE